MRAARILACVIAGLFLAAAPARAQIGALLSPGALAKPHANLEGVSNCAKCHQQGRKVTAEKCLACHAPIAQRVARKFGVHKDAAGECVMCHVEHAGVDGELRPFDQKAFDHRGVTGFPLTGKHTLGAAQCAACHKGRSFVDLSPTCTSCHADVHKPSLGATCTACHSTEAAFKDASTRFDHSKAAFQLTGAHQKLACASCHKGGAYKGVAFASCTSCHREPHEPSLGATCTSCHTTDSWRTKTVNHARTNFPLNGGHAKLTCEACHKQPATKVALKFDRCTACHDDAHRGNFTQDCRACHTEGGWKGGRFDHASTRFALTGKHTGVACEKCHRPGGAAAPPRLAASTRSTVPRAIEFRGLTTTCISCHADVHQGDLDTRCESCHTVDSFTRDSYEHRKADAFFKGQHASLTCQKCHATAGGVPPVATATRVGAVSGRPAPPRFAAAERRCSACHQDVHLGQLSAACETCHAIDVPRFAVTLDHTRQTAFALRGAHEKVVCRDCHKTETARFPAASGTAVRFKGVGTTCVACHQDVHLGQLSGGCESCHSTDTFHLTKYVHRARPVVAMMTGAHARAACVDCHKRATGKFPASSGTAIRFVTGTTCVSCHVDQHRGALGSNCGNCHRP
ncbi:MAG: cytochrome c3 family protein [Vicinamibacterales bacterium]